MEFPVESKISNFIENQFPSFYKEEGKDFILFVKTYYEWLESTDNPIWFSRNILNIKDVDNTLTNFLDYFQKKYVFGIPANVITNKRFLIKHILDVYRSKSSIEGYKLLFRIVYNEDLDVYLPGNDILRVSDGTWKEPKYIEISNVSNTENLIGKTIIGTSSLTTGIVENYVKHPINGSIVSLLYLSNIYPKGADFNIGEKVYNYEETNSENIDQIIADSPKIVGSLNSISILSGGDSFKIGDVLKIAHRDLSNNSLISKGVDGLVRVTEVSRKLGTLTFTIPYGGFGFTTTSNTYIYNAPTDITGSGGDFDVGSISNAREIVYNTDCIADFLNSTLDISAFGLLGNASANLSSNLDISLSYSNAIFGSVAVLTNIISGNGYTQVPYTFVKCTYDSNSLPGTISYDTTSNVVTGTSTTFTSYFTTNSVIYIQANTLSTTGEYHIVKNVTNATSIELYGPPSINSTGTAIYKISPEILKSNFALYDDELNYANVSISSYNELDANVFAVPSLGNTSVTKVSALNSGKGYIEGEFVKLYLYSGVSTPTIVDGGIGYTNNQPLIFSGGNPYKHAQGYVETNSVGGIISLVMENLGSGYSATPNVTIRSTSGSNAVITTTLEEYNTSYEVSGEVVLSGLGVQKGSWTTTRGFLNSDKYIQDSYYYQDYSYELRTALVLNKYKDIIYNNFHIAGSELFGKYLLRTDENINFDVSSESNVFIKTITDDSITVDSNTITADTISITTDMTYILT